MTAYIVDTGIRYDHQEFAGRAAAGYDFRKSNGGVDCHGHGTHVAGTVGGSTYGVAKRVSLVSVRVLDCDGSGTLSNVIAGLDWVAKNSVRPAVVNMSIGGGFSPNAERCRRGSCGGGRQRRRRGRQQRRGCVPALAGQRAVRHYRLSPPAGQAVEVTKSS